MKEESNTKPMTSTHYDEDYFNWQESHGEFGGWAHAAIYKNSIRKTDTVLDFGCGGGFLLKNIDCNKKYGIEPNPAARKRAIANGLAVFANAEEAIGALGVESIDIVISNNALEHALEPWRELTHLLPIIKKGGRFHFVLPCEGILWRYKSDDINQHLYSWSPQSGGNLFKSAGFEVESSRAYIHKWPPRIYRMISKLGRTIFDLSCRIWGHLDWRWYQIEVQGRKPLK